MPVVTLALSMVLRLIPQLARQAQDTRNAMRVAIGTSARKEEASRLLGMLLSNALEDSVERSDSMRARGWGASRTRTVLRMHAFRRKDALALTGVAILLATSAIGLTTYVSGWQFYPRMHTVAPTAALAPFALLVLLPACMVWAGRLVED